jgi:hypothetical protein
MKRVLLTLVGSLALAVPCVSDPRTVRVAEAGTYLGIVGIDSSDEPLLAASTPQGETVLLHCGNAKCIEKGRTKSLGRLWAAASTPLGTVLAFGMGRGELTAPIRLVLLDKDWKSGSTVFELPSERSQINLLRMKDGKLWLSYFRSKFETVLGSFTPTARVPWRFTETRAGRLEDAIDVDTLRIAVGRPYGDRVGLDGDLSIVQHGDGTALLPTYRGVRAVRFLEGRAGAMGALLVADGWHQNYGQSAQARLGLIEYNKSLQRYGHHLIDHDPEQYGFSRLHPINLGEKDFGVVAVGDRFINLYRYANRFQRVRVSAATSQQEVLDGVLLTASEKSALLAVFNGWLDLVEVSF